MPFSMRPITQFQHLMSSTVLIALRTGVDADGKPTYGTDVAYPAHISRRRRIHRTANGQEVTSEQAINLGVNVDVPLTARVTLSTGDVGSTSDSARFPPIVEVKRRFDGEGPHSTVVYLGAGGQAFGGSL